MTKSGMIVHLVRLALEEKREDVQLMARRLARKTSVSDPDLSEALSETIENYGHPVGVDAILRAI